MKKVETLLFILLMAILIPLEVLCAYLAYETIGEVVRVLYFLVIGINLVFIFLALRNRAVAALGAVALGMMIIPYQLFLGHRLLRVQAEAARIVSYAYEYKLDTGQYPPDLSNYELHDPEMKEFIRSYTTDAEHTSFALYYRVGTENTSHSYTPEHGWGYYPD